MNTVCICIGYLMPLYSWICCSMYSFLLTLHELYRNVWPHSTKSYAVLAGKYCGADKPMPLVSLTNRLTVYFNTNEMTNNKGFKAHYKTVAPELTSGKSISTRRLPWPWHNVRCPSYSIWLTQKVNVRMDAGLKWGWGAGGSRGLYCDYPWGACTAEVLFLLRVARISRRWRLSSRWRGAYDDPWLSGAGVPKWSAIPGTQAHTNINK